MLKITVSECKGLRKGVKPYVDVRAGKESFKTKASVTCKWNETFYMGLQADRITFTLWHGVDTFLGFSEVSLDGLMLDDDAMDLKLRPRTTEVVTGSLVVTVSIGEPAPPKPEKKAAVPSAGGAAAGALAAGLGGGSMDSLPGGAAPSLPPGKVWETGGKMSKSVQSAFAKRVQAVQASGEEQLDVVGMNLTYLPATLGKLQFQLIDLQAGFNKLEKWPMVQPFVSLQVLHLDANQLKGVPASIGKLTGLRELNLRGNKIEYLADEICALTRLERLWLSNNALTDLPKNFGDMLALEELTLNGNALTAFPPSIQKLRRLFSLDASSCHIKTLPDGFGLMTRLVELNLGHNEIKALPESIGLMTRMVTLELSDNNISAVPTSLGNCQGLTAFFLERNPLADSELVAQLRVSGQSAVDYLSRKMQSEDFEIEDLVSRVKEIDMVGDKSSPGMRRLQRKAPGNASTSALPTSASPPSLGAAPSSASFSSLPTAKSTPEPKKKPVAKKPTPAPAKAEPVKSDAAISPELEAKLMKVRKEARGMLTGVVRRLLEWKKQVEAAKEIPDVVSVASMMKGLRRTVDALRPLLGNVDPPAAAKAVPGEPKIVTARRTILAALSDLEHIIRALVKAMDSEKDPKKLVTLAKSVKELDTKSKA